VANVSPPDEQVVEKLEKRLDSLQIEKQKIQDEFGIQRAKMKDLFLQKESKWRRNCTNLKELARANVL
jgi:Rab GTPase-binding effector protein 1